MKFLAALLVSIPFSLNAQEAPTAVDFMDGLNGSDVTLRGVIVFRLDKNYFGYFEERQGNMLTEFIAYLDSGQEDRSEIQTKCAVGKTFKFEHACKIEGAGKVETNGNQVRISITEVTALDR